MSRAAFLVFAVAFALLATTTRLRAVAASETATYNPDTQVYNYTYTYNDSPPTEPDDANWGSGWPESGDTGLDYVGSTNTCSAVYLGKGFVLTAYHVGAGNFTLDGQTYDAIAGSAVQIGSSDLTLFQINQTSTTGNTLNLNPLNLSTSTPAVGSTVVMIGYGNNQGETWAENTVAQTNYDVPLSDYNTDSTDFLTTDTFQNEVNNVSTTTDGQLVSGDSGGGAFIYNNATHQWELAGINEVLLEDPDDHDKIDGSGMIQLSDYSAQIQADMAPEPPAWLLALAGVAILGGVRRGRRDVASRV